MAGVSEERTVHNTQTTFYSFTPRTHMTQTRMHTHTTLISLNGK